MCAPYHLRIGCKLARPLATAGNPECIERRDDFFRSRQASAPGRRQSGLQRGIVRINAEPDNMNCVAAPGDRNFDAVNQPQRKPFCCGPRRGQSAGVVVIGQREHGNAALCCTRD